VDPVFATEVVNFTVRLLEERFDAMGLDKNKREKENLEINMANSLDEIKNLQIQAQTFAHTPGVSASTASLEAARLQIELDAQRQVYSQLKVQYELDKVALASEAPIFKILELAEPPDMKSGPRRSLLCLIGTFSAGFLGVLIAFALHAAECFKNDPVAMAKLRGIKRSVS
ncbi:MAG: lipopolysaccharide biosynthesis protein, partial [Spirochaetaceae bacterium]|nr:lipopolysaccharide biosynthesis protein [Spirochaetaceae bacterium]